MSQYRPWNTVPPEAEFPCGSVDVLKLQECPTLEWVPVAGLINSVSGSRSVGPLPPSLGIHAGPGKASCSGMAPSRSSCTAADLRTALCFLPEGTVSLHWWLACCKTLNLGV